MKKIILTLDLAFALPAFAQPANGKVVLVPEDGATASNWNSDTTFPVVRAENGKPVGNSQHGVLPTFILNFLRQASVESGAFSISKGLIPNLPKVEVPMGPQGLLPSTRLVVVPLEDDSEYVLGSCDNRESEIAPVNNAPNAALMTCFVSRKDGGEARWMEESEYKKVQADFLAGKIFRIEVRAELNATERDFPIRDKYLRFTWSNLDDLKNILASARKRLEAFGSGPWSTYLVAGALGSDALTSVGSICSNAKPAFCMELQNSMLSNTEKWQHLVAMRNLIAGQVITRLMRTDENGFATLLPRDSVTQDTVGEVSYRYLRGPSTEYTLETREEPFSFTYAPKLGFRIL